MSRRDLDEMDQQVAHRVVYSREKAGLTQIELANLLGISLQQVRKYEYGINRISAGRLWAIARACKVPIQSMFQPVRIKK